MRYHKPAMRSKPSSGFVRAAFTHLAIIAASLVLLDLVLIWTGLFPPTYRYGDPDVGWVSATEPGELACIDQSSGTTYQVAYNEDGHRSAWPAARLRGPGDRFEVAVSGDSHTDLCASNELTHFGVLERELTRRGIPAATYSYGAGRYSPLQAYLAIAPGIAWNQADAFVLNLYTGNDFYDMLRIDDRPHFVGKSEGSYQIAAPVWYSFDDPASANPSRMLYLGRELMEKTGMQALWVRLSFLYDTARQQGEGMPAVVAYVNDMRHSLAPELGYPAAFAAQLLNQQLFFYRFPNSAEESMARVKALLRMIRERHPDVLLVMSPIPSYQLALQGEPDAAFTAALGRLPLTREESAGMEEEMYEALRRASHDAGWLFVDTLTALRSYRGGERLYNEFDYHITPPASALIGALQAETLAAADLNL